MPISETILATAPIAEKIGVCCRRQMYHLAPRSLREQIAVKGLLPGLPHEHGFTPDESCNGYYGTSPIYLSDTPGCSSEISFTGIAKGGYDVWSADTREHPLLADLCCMSDTGIFICADGRIGWDPVNSRAQELFRGHLSEVTLSAADLLADPRLNEAAIDLTETAATVVPILPERLRLLVPGEYSDDFIHCWLANP